VSDCSVTCHDGIVTGARAVGVLSSCDMIMAEAGEALVSCLLGERR
jgi:hypothetical protein